MSPPHSCILLRADNTPIDGPTSVQCSECQWACLNNAECAVISMYYNPAITTPQEVSLCLWHSHRVVKQGWA